jgi:glycosyltransferase involved in cell wall biosynthesis
MNRVRKKILFVRTALGQGGADRVTLIVLQNLDAKRFDCSLLLMRKEGEYLSSLPAGVSVISDKSSSLWTFLPVLIRTIKKIQPDVVFSIDGGMNVPLAIASFLSPFRKWKSVLSERNILFPPGKNRLKRGTLVLAKLIFYRFADGITAVSEGVRKEMSDRLMLSLPRISVVHNPMVEKHMLERAREAVVHPWFDTVHAIPVIVHAGRFVEQKDHRTLIRAFEIVQKNIPCRLFLLGEGPMLESVKKLVHEKGLQASVHFAGFDLNPFRYFSKCDLFVLSSLHEGLPGVLIQAMACGAPVVSTDCPFGPNEIITRPGKNGLLVSVSDPVAMAEAMQKVLTDKALAGELKREAPVAVRIFEVEEAMKSYLAAIET